MPASAWGKASFGWSRIKQGSESPSGGFRILYGISRCFLLLFRLKFPKFMLEAYRGTAVCLFTALNQKAQAQKRCNALGHFLSNIANRIALMWYLAQVGRASSRLLNAIMGGEGDTTFSAYSYHLAMNGRRPISRAYGRVRVAIVDGLLGNGHCWEAWDWHHERGLFNIDK